ncbi:hypothetical protein X801_08132 [Opisthorchis viverrini]|uniref:Reverse transcriptase RNase H-like domain-containing protein n=1 Tax=Opisthorchis viverrini TaxID=6198 RepID=A0A1S8WNI7_OPIVI|nr:hypothetical protein X801_08132 [Opisthorchis viverrini]
MTSLRTRRLALKLACYRYHLRYTPGQGNLTADALSRLPLRDLPLHTSKPAELVDGGIGDSVLSNTFSTLPFWRNFRRIYGPQASTWNSKENKLIPQMTSLRTRRLALKLACYRYHLRYTPGQGNLTADALSRLPLRDLPLHTSKPAELVDGLMTCLSLLQKYE